MNANRKRVNSQLISACSKLAMEKLEKMCKIYPES